MVQGKHLLPDNVNLTQHDHTHLKLLSKYLFKFPIQSALRILRSFAVSHAQTKLQ